MKSRKEIATEFEHLVVSGKVTEAYDKHVCPDFRHHNPYVKGDRQSLLEGMEENADKFADKDYEIKRVLEDEDLVMTHARLKMSPQNRDVSVVHIYRFDGDKIAEEWDLAQQLPDGSPNENGLF